MESAAILNGMRWTDTEGREIHAHGGGFLYDNEYIYWFGENRTGRRRVSCCRSKNLKEWEFRRDVLTLDSSVKPVYYRTNLELEPVAADGTVSSQGAVIERPKVLYNEKTGKYVMWMHWENGRDYHDARCAVATCDTVDGDYVYHGSFNPIGYMSRDCTLFCDDDGTAYFLSAARDNADLHMYRLSEDYMSIEEQVKTLWPGQYREAPAVMKRNGMYYLLTSACTGWLPNQGAYAYSESLTGRWSPLLPLGDGTTFDTQPTFVLPIYGKDETIYLYIGDRWDPSDYHQSSYVFLPLVFSGKTEMSLSWADAIDYDPALGAVRTQTRENLGIRLKNCAADRFLAVRVDEKNGVSGVHVQDLSYTSQDQRWDTEDVRDGLFRLRHTATGLYLAAAGGLEEHGQVSLATFNDSRDSAYLWRKVELEQGLCRLRNHLTETCLTLTADDGESLHLSADGGEWNPRKGRDPQAFLISKIFGN
ncbi:family 43 glycosylhydrolase [Gorillibacterium massiliense]|uniref:family 43 glycosylhydrolase n=1 Tax=Gorillibacterium massiliense TaxID=1280390 RepID=UPI0004AFCFB5|nr:family 43 glycosylhydrolase [Gorillibacterium massiliense]